MSDSPKHDPLIKHMEEDKAFQDKMGRVLFGDVETQEIGMKEKVDQVYELLITGKGIWGIIGKIQWTIAFVLLLGAFWTMIKGKFFAL